MSFPQEVKSTLWAIVTLWPVTKTLCQKSRCGFFTRPQTRLCKALLRFFLRMGCGCINHELLKFFSFHPQEVPTAFRLHPAAGKAPARRFPPYPLHSLNFAFPQQRNSAGKYSLIAADGCEFNIARNPGILPPFILPAGNQKKASMPSTRPLCIPVCQTLPWMLLFSRSDKKNEYAALCQLLDRYRYGGCPIFIADRGFASYNVFAHALENVFFFAIRAKDINVKRFLAVDTLPPQMDQWASVILTRSTAPKRRLQPELGHLYRYVCKNVSLTLSRTAVPSISCGCVWSVSR